MDYKRLHSLEGELKQEKINLTYQFRKEHKIWFLALDILFILCILMNIGAVAITNAMVVRVEPEVVIMEANPVQSKLNNYQVHPEAVETMKTLAIQSVFWVMMFLGFIIQRFRTYNPYQFAFYLAIWVFVCYTLAWDCFNDLGFMIGKLIWGAL